MYCLPSCMYVIGVPAVPTSSSVIARLRVERSALHVGTTLRSRKLDYQAGSKLDAGNLNR